MSDLKKILFGALAAGALITTGCEDRSKSVLDRDEGTVEETREAVDNAAKDIEQNVENDRK